MQCNRVFSPYEDGTTFLGLRLGHNVVTRSLDLVTLYRQRLPLRKMWVRNPHNHKVINYAMSSDETAHE